MTTEVKNFGQIDFVAVENVKNPEKYLIKTAEILNKFGVNWYLSFGTALGFYRDKDFIRGDTDIDICVLMDDQEEIDKMIDVIESVYPIIRIVTEHDRYMQVAFQDSSNFIIDICFFYENDKGYYSYCEGGKWQDRKEVIGTPKPLKTKYGIFPVPEKIEEYLKDRYGDWQTPKPGAITSSIKA